jgi:serine/threonine protein kinase
VAAAEVPAVAAAEAPAAAEPEAPAAAPAPEVSGYRLGAEVSRDETGTAYQAVHLASNRQVQLKLLNAAAPGSSFGQEFMDALRAVGKARHPALAHIYGGGRSGGRCYYASDRPAGKSLEEVSAARQGVLDARRGCQLTHALALALAEWDKQRIAHCALTAREVLLADDGAPRLHGLGFVEAADRKALTSGRRAAFVAPEVIAGGAPGPRAEVYSLGALLFQMLSGSPPPAGGSPPVEALNAMPRGAAAVVVRAAAPKPEDRYAGPGELAAALDQFLKAKPSSRSIAPGAAAPAAPAAAAPAPKPDDDKNGAAAVARRPSSRRRHRW